MSTTPVPAPKSGGALKIILIVLGVIALVVVLTVGAFVYIGYRVMHSISHSADGKTVSVLGTTMTPTDSASLTAQDLGTEIYPGSAPTKEGSKMSLPNASVVSGTYLTSDPVSKVEAFYKDKLGSGATDFNMGGTALLTKKISDKETISVTTTSKDPNSKTKIVIQHTTTK